MVCINILILAEYLDDISHPETYNSRFLQLSDLLTSAGHKVTIVTTDFVHSLKQHVYGVSKYHDCDLFALHEPGYKKNICLKRFYSHRILSKNLKKWLNTCERPDEIYCAVPSLDFAYEAARYAQKNNVRFIIDVQDLWPEAFKMVAKNPLVQFGISLLFDSRANYIYKTADEIAAVSQSYADRALRVNKKCSQGLVVYLGTNLADFDKYRQLELPDNDNLKKHKDDIWLGYVGTLGYSYDIKTVIDSIALLKDKPYYKNIKFIIAGDGPLRKEFENHAKSRQVNAYFTGKLPYPQMVSLLCKCDIAINAIVKNAAGSIINKHGDYAAAGIPVVSSQECEEYRNLIDKWDMGYNCNCEDSKDFCEKIAYLIENEDVRKQKGSNARRCAENCFAREYTYPKIIEKIEYRVG